MKGYSKSHERYNMNIGQIFKIAKEAHFYS